MSSILSSQDQGCTSILAAAKLRQGHRVKRWLGGPPETYIKVKYQFFDNCGLLIPLHSTSNWLIRAL